MMGSSPRCYIPSFVEISPPIPEMKIFEGVLPYMGMVAIIGHVTSIILMNFITMYIKAYIQTLVSEKSMF